MRTPVEREPIDHGPQHEPEQALDAPAVVAHLREPNAEFFKNLTTAIRAGVALSTAAEWAGISRRTFKVWMRRTGEPFDTLRAQVRSARAHARVKLEAKVAEKHPEKALRTLQAREHNAQLGRRYAQTSRPYTRDGHSLVIKAAPYLAARVADEHVPDLHLSEVERAARDLRREMIDDLGGIAHVSATKRALIDSTIGTWIIAQSIDVVLFKMAADQGLVSLRHRRAFPIVTDRLRAASVLASQLTALGLERQSAPPQDLNTYIAQKYGSNGSHEETEPVKET